jgi:dinuclear metal center YbgI/SA1388 family protein
VNVRDLASTMETVAPARYAASWDNVGLIVGNPGRPLARVLLAIDCTHAVLEEARRTGAEAIVAYHPPLFAAQKRFVAGSVAYAAASAGIAIYSPHTAFDVAEGGTNDVLADAAGMTDRAPLRPLEATDRELKLVTFVPAEHVESVSLALFDAGAGHIGRYSSCSFRSTGTGTFFGEEGTHPTVGRPGRLEQSPEVRLETVVHVRDAEAVVRALRRAHPYEEPAFDLVRLAAPPEGKGMGRIGNVPQAPLAALVDRLKRALDVEHVLAAGSLQREVSRVAVCAGSGAELVQDALAAGADAFVTGEMRHHEALAAQAAGLALVCTRHSTSERAALVALERRLVELLPGVAVSCSREDRDPFFFA